MIIYLPYIIAGLAFLGMGLSAVCLGFILDIKSRLEERPDQVDAVDYCCGGSNADSMHYMGSRMRKRRIGRRR